MTTGQVAVLAAGCLLGLASLAALDGCGSAPPSAQGAAAGASCGETRTAANVPVVIKVAKGPADCAAALRVERGYAAAIRSGSLRGNGGGAPLGVDGWTCQTYPTSQVLRTGDASECHTASAEVVAELALPASPAV